MPQNNAIRNRMRRARVKKIRICNVAPQYADKLIDYMSQWAIQCTNTIFTQKQD